MRHRFVLLAALLAGLAAALAPAPLRAQSTDSTLVPLQDVIVQVQYALARYQVSLGTGPNALPPLKSVVFDFKTTTGHSTGFSINLLIFTIGASKESELVNDVTFSYAVPKATPQMRIKFARSPTIADELYETIRSAAQAVTSASSVGGVPFSQLAVTLQYGVKWDANGGAKGTISIVTVGLKADKNNNAVQSIKLVFAK